MGGVDKGGGSNGNSRYGQQGGWLRRFGRFGRRRLFHLWHLLLVVLVGASIFITATAYDGLETLPWWFIALLVLLLSAFYLYEGPRRNALIVIAGLAAVAIIILLSFFISVPEGSYAVLQRPGEMLLLAGGELKWLWPPYIIKLSHIPGQQRLSFTAGPELDDGGQILWDFSANLKVTEDYSQAFQVLVKVRSGPAWKAAVRQAFEEGVRAYLASNPQVQTFPREFKFELPQEYQTKLAELGYTVSPVQAKNLRFIPASRSLQEGRH